jgi:SnoaL-like domain
MTTLIEKINDLNNLVLQGKPLDAFEKYYHDDVVMQENENIPTRGKVANRKREEEFFSSISEFRNAKPLKVTVGEGTTMVQWHYDYTHREWGVRNYIQVSVQEWMNGKIIREQFFYGN